PAPLQRSARLSLLHSFPTRRSSDLMTFNNEDIQNETNLTVEGKANDLQVKSSSADFKNLKILDGKTLQGEFVEDETYQVILNSRSEEHTSELQSRFDLVCRLLLEKK